MHLRAQRRRQVQRQQQQEQHCKASRKQPCSQAALFAAGYLLESC
jgi:hypothetical protein